MKKVKRPWGITLHSFLIYLFVISIFVLPAYAVASPDDVESDDEGSISNQINKKDKPRKPDSNGPLDNADRITSNDHGKATSGENKARVVDLQAARSSGDKGSDEAYGIALPNGKVIHKTNDKIVNLKTISIEGESTQLYTWDEDRGNGKNQPYYAISRDGKSLASRVRATSYDIKLRAHIFDPLKGLPKISPKLSSDFDNALYLVQFHTTALPTFRKKIKSLSGKVHRYLADHTFIVEMNADTRSQVSALPYVRWVGEYHPEYRLEKPLRDAIKGKADRLESQRYSIMLTEKGKEIQGSIKKKILSLGGKIDLEMPKGYRIEATLDQDQLQAISQENEVQFIDRWGGPGETDMNIVRAVGGANYLEGLQGWTGQGVRGEIFDTEIRTTHQEWLNPPIIHSTGTTGSAHGTSAYSNVFAQGVDPDARGILPDGQGIFFRYSESSQFGGPISRYDINQQLTDPAGIYQAVFQTSSVGSARTTDYTTVSAEVDDYLFLHPILSLQSQSNAGARPSRPQAWAKNIVSVGGFYHQGTEARTDDAWYSGNGGSIGPADDGRIKPDLAFFYDGIRSANSSSDTSYSNFGGTSSATPQTAGHFGMMFQMWHQGLWPSFGGGTSVFDSRPQMATAKALMINQAHQYDWNSGGANASLNRYVQGWGTADVRRLYDNASRMSIIDESDPILPLGTNSYSVEVLPAQSDLRVTMVYTDPMGTVGAVVDRINDLSLRVTSPSGTIYWGNNGLTASNVSTPGGVSNTVDTVENVILQNPEAGTWTVDVIADDLVQDARLETPALDADYGLVIAGGQIDVTPPEPPASEITLPAYDRTYSDATRTRGYWFTAPTDFVITGLQVPDEIGHGTQHVELVRFDAGVVPPAYSSTTNAFTSLFRRTSVSSGDIIDVNVSVQAGDVIGVLGATGTTSMMHNSYSSAGPHTTTILGLSTPIKRMGMQFNLAANPAQSLWTESSDVIARVRMFVEEPSVEYSVALAPYNYTYSSSSRTRGFWFVAPVDFKLSGLKVPDEQAAGLQNVEVVRFNGGTPPPAWSSTTNNFVSLARHTGVPANEVIAVDIQVNAGDVIGVLGAAGDSTMLHNSYGSGSHTAEIFGNSVTFNRMGMQYNVVTTPAQYIWSEAGGHAGRIELFYK